MFTLKKFDTRVSYQCCKLAITDEFNFWERHDFWISEILRLEAEFLFICVNDYEHAAPLLQGGAACCDATIYV